MPVAQLHGRGARVGFTEYEAESGCYMGTEIGPSRALYTIAAAEASGRRAVRLDRRGQYVEFTLARPANAVTVRYAMPNWRTDRALTPRSVSMSEASGWRRFR